MRKTRKPNSAFRQEDPSLRRAEILANIRELKKRGERLERTSFAVHGCNRCTTCTGRCPT